jgi:hypothetical protein
MRHQAVQWDRRHQFSPVFSAWSTTMTSTEPFVDSSFSPGFSCNAVKIDGPSGELTGVPGTPSTGVEHGPESGLHSRRNIPRFAANPELEPLSQNRLEPQSYVSHSVRRVARCSWGVIGGAPVGDVVALRVQPPRPCQNLKVPNAIGGFNDISESAIRDIQASPGMNWNVDPRESPGLLGLTNAASKVDAFIGRYEN